MFLDNNENYFKLIKASVETLFTTCDENDYNVRLTAEENFDKFVKDLKEADLTRIQVELYRIIKHNPNVGPNALKDQLLEHQNQNASTHLIIDYLDLIKKIIQLLRYSNLFDFDQLLISTQIGSIEETSFFIWVFFSKTIAYSTYQHITYLLSLCEHGDLHLRGACANLLVTLIQTTIHLLTLSSLSNSFINQCSLVSTDSKDSSSHAFTIIGIKLLEDSIQHTTSSCTLVQVSLAQFIDDIDFRQWRNGALG
ncbi:unnamed protein product [Rotaria sp. Silwood1]|nr:unnamed protein product [Rotaria sp. Silwood1]